MELFDITGRLVKKQAILNLSTRVAINELSAGIYILKINDVKGKIIRTEKMIIQR